MRDGRGWIGIVMLGLMGVLGGGVPAEAACPPGCSISLTWTDTSTDEDGFFVQRGGTQAGPFTQIGGAQPPNTTSYIDAGLTDGVMWCYRVSAFNNAGTSPYSNTACGTIPLAPPTTLAAAFVAGQGVKVTWLNTSANQTGQEVERAALAAGPFTRLTTTTASTSNYTDAAAVTPGATYHYRVRSVNASMASVYTSVTAVTVPVTIPNAPTNLKVTVSTAFIDGAQGTVVSEPTGVRCPPTCTAAFSQMPVLQAQPASGSRLSSWRVTSSASSCAGSTCSPIVALFVRATFRR